MRSLILLCSMLCLTILPVSPAAALDEAVDATIVSAGENGPGQCRVRKLTLNRCNRRQNPPMGHSLPCIPGYGWICAGLQAHRLHSIFAINVDVNDGGLASFRYRMQTYDAGTWDWDEISHGESYTKCSDSSSVWANPAAYWRSPLVTTSQTLDALER